MVQLKYIYGRNLRLCENPTVPLWSQHSDNLNKYAELMLLRLQ